MASSKRSRDAAPAVPPARASRAPRPKGTIDMLRMLQQLSNALVRARTSDEVIWVLVSEATAALGAQGGSLYVVAADGATLDLAATVGTPRDVTDRYGRIPLDAPLPVADAFVDMRGIFVESVDDFHLRYPTITPLTNAAFACIPVAVNARGLGVLAFSFGAHRRFAPRERSFLTAVASQGAVALERIRHLEEARHAEERADVALKDLAMLYGFTDDLNRTTSLDQALQLALDGIGRVLEVGRSAILLRDTQGVMRFAAWRGLSEEYRRAVDGHSLWPADARDPAAIYVSDVEAAPTLRRYLPVFAKESIRALAFVPLVSGGVLLGKFMIYARERRPFDERERKLAGAIAAQLAFAVDRRRAEKERADATATAEGLVQSLQRTLVFVDRFVGTLGHDLRNPVSAIRYAAEVVWRHAETTDVARVSEVILASTERLARMLNQLLDLAHVRMGAGMRIAPQPCDLKPICGRIAGELEASRPATVVAIDSVGDTAGIWDKDRIAHLLANVIGNAVQHGKHRKVAVHLDGTDVNRVIVEVRNVGRMPPELMATVFDPFRSATPAHPDAGLGFGLYISDHIARAHGGSIDISSDDRETTVLISLPRRTPEAPDD